MTDTPALEAEKLNGDMPAEPCIPVPVGLAQRMLDILAQLPYGQVADVVNELRDLKVEEP